MDKKRKITEFLYNNTFNQSSRKLSYPRDVDGIQKVISSINIEVSTAFNSLLIRVQFFGSKTYFSMPITQDRKDYWWNIMCEFLIQKPDIIDIEDVIEVDTEDNTHALPTTVGSEQIEDNSTVGSKDLEEPDTIGYDDDVLCSCCRLPMSSCVNR